MKITIINACSDLGVDVDGASLGPLVLKKSLKEIEDIDIIDYTCDNENKSHDKHDLAKNYERLLAFTKELYNGIVNLNNSFILTIGGDHSIAVSSSLASIQKEGDLGIIWIDAHADYNTFETTITGNLHGLPLATINGLNEKLSLFHNGKYYDAHKTVIVGYRAIEENKDREVANLDKSGVTYFTTKDLNNEDTIEKAFAIASNNGKNKVHISFDMDFIDPMYASGVSIPEPNGPSDKETLKIIEKILAKKHLIASFDVVEFNPLNDKDKKTEKLALTIIKRIIEEMK